MKIDCIPEHRLRLVYKCQASRSTTAFANCAATVTSTQLRTSQVELRRRHDAKWTNKLVHSESRDGWKSKNAEVCGPRWMILTEPGLDGECGSAVHACAGRTCQWLEELTLPSPCWIETVWSSIDSACPVHGGPWPLSRRALSLPCCVPGLRKRLATSTIKPSSNNLRDSLTERVWATLRNRSPQQ